MIKITPDVIGKRVTIQGSTNPRDIGVITEVRPYTWHTCQSLQTHEVKITYIETLGYDWWLNQDLIGVNDD